MKTALLAYKIGVICYFAEDNATHMIVDFDWLKKNLHYKNAVFAVWDITKKMQEDVQYFRSAWQRNKRVQHTSGLANMVEAIKAKITTEPAGTITYIPLYWNN